MFKRGDVVVRKNNAAKGVVYKDPKSDILSVLTIEGPGGIKLASGTITTWHVSQVIQVKGE